MSKSLSEHVANLESLNDTARATRRFWIKALRKAQQYADELETENDRLEAENDALRAGRGRWPEKADDFPCCTSTLPRVISAEELRAGMVVAVQQMHGGHWDLGTYTETNPHGAIWVGGVGIGLHPTESTIVLLEDAPQPTGYAADGHCDRGPCWKEPGHDDDCEPGPGRWTTGYADDAAKTEPEIVTAETIRASEPGSTWEDCDGAVWEWTGEELKHHLRDKDKGGCMDHGGFYRLGRSPSYLIETYGPITRSTAAPRGDYGTPPRLTVHRLNVAPVGSYLSRGVDSDERRKWEDGLWQGAWMFEGQYPETSEDLIAAGWADATLRLPEAQ